MASETEADAYLQPLASKLQGMGVKAKVMILDAQDPAAAISETAESEDADLIVMCTHGRTGAERWLLGSVTDRVIRSSGVPVHVIPVRG